MCDSQIISSKILQFALLIWNEEQMEISGAHFGNRSFQAADEWVHWVNSRGAARATCTIVHLKIYETSRTWFSFLWLHQLQYNWLLSSKQLPTDSLAHSIGRFDGFNKPFGSFVGRVIGGCIDFPHWIVALKAYSVSNFGLVVSICFFFVYRLLWPYDIISSQGNL